MQSLTLLFTGLLVVSLAVMVFSAPVEEKEQEEVEVEVEATDGGEGELSEEEEDDDDSKSQDRIDEGVVGVQQTTAMAAVPGGSGFEGVESDTHINGQKLLNGAGAGGGGASSHAGNLGSFGGGVTHLDYTGGFDSSGHDFLLSLMGGGDPFGPGVYLNGPGDMTPPTQLDSTAFGSSVTPIQSAHLDSGSSLDSHAVSLSSSSSSSPLVHSDSDREQTGGADSADVNGNGRLTLLSDTNGAGAAQPVTDLHGDRTASDDGHSHHHTESSPVISFTNSQQPGGNFQADLVTMVTESTGTNTGHPGAATENTQTAGPVTEQYHPSGQGPEGAENVELEDTC